MATFKTGNGRRVAFWTDSWIGDLPLKFQFPNIFRLAQQPNDSVAAHWEIRLLKDEEIQDFQYLLTLISHKDLTDLDDRRVWSLESSGHFSVKSLSKHLSPSSPLEKDYFKTLWSPRRINFLVWIMAVGSLNCSETMQRKLPNTCLLPTVCPLCLENSELLITYSFSVSSHQIVGLAYFLCSNQFGSLMVRLAPMCAIY